MPRNYFLSPTAIGHLRGHKKWSIEHFGHTTTKKYFQDMDKGFQYIADNYKQFAARSYLTGESELSVYLMREHYVIYVPLKDGVHIADILGRTQDIPNILRENASIFQRELSQVIAPPKHGNERKGIKHR
ncbi:MAG: type II toxin-antitoxin system RelE/ParE family toxin [Alphaproteobacteria bacterium]